MHLCRRICRWSPAHHPAGRYGPPTESDLTPDLHYNGPEYRSCCWRVVERFPSSQLSYWTVYCSSSSEYFKLAIGNHAYSYTSSKVMIPLAADLSPPSRRAQCMAIVLSGLLMGILIARVLSGIIAQVSALPAIPFFVSKRLSSIGSRSIVRFVESCILHGDRCSIRHLGGTLLRHARLSCQESRP